MNYVELLFDKEEEAKRGRIVDTLSGYMAYGRITASKGKLYLNTSYFLSFANYNSIAFHKDLFKEYKFNYLTGMFKREFDDAFLTRKNTPEYLASKLSEGHLFSFVFQNVIIPDFDSLYKAFSEEQEQAKETKQERLLRYINRFLGK